MANLDTVKANLYREWCAFEAARASYKLALAEYEAVAPDWDKFEQPGMEHLEKGVGS
ncbi:MAG: hypothetical protein Q8P59_09740 [Dehalococcoidia bacterium]|nr:hypothetical protein [Dehalococcoidia bacterium]